MVYQLVKVMTAAFLAGQLVIVGAQAQDDASDDVRKIASFEVLDLSHYPPKWDINDGFLTLDTAPDSAALLPPPPEEGTARYASDVEAYETAALLRDTPRWILARDDASLPVETIGQEFSAVFGLDISPQTLPITYNLMYRVSVSVGGPAVNKAKKLYMRARPFVHYGVSSCHLPAEEEAIRNSGSYPSGHAANGWAQALILAEISPEYQEAILQRGFDFGQSRVICAAHWQSDVDAGRLIGAAALARLRTISEFVQQLEAAKREVAALR